MKRYTDNELEHFLNDLESDLVERKESFKGDVPKKVRQAVCAFANDFPNRNGAGVLFIGAKDDGSPSGLSVTDQLFTNSFRYQSRWKYSSLASDDCRKEIVKKI